jgi:GNAT superfamily N-acetyltransferase
MTHRPDIEIVEVDDERIPLADEAIALFERTFDRRDRHAVDELRSEIAEKRLELLPPFDFHLLVAHAEGHVSGAIMGCYMAGANAGFVNYLAVPESMRGMGVGRLLRPRLVELFKGDALRHSDTQLAWVIGEVRLDNPWMRRLVRNRGAIPFDLTYYHPGMRPSSNAPPYVLYRQPFADRRVELPTSFVRRILYTVYRRAYRVRYPLEHEGFRNMLSQLEGREVIGAHPDFDMPAPDEDE